MRKLLGAWQLARNVECEQIAKDAQEKLAHAKHEIACELVAKQADIQRLKSENEELKERIQDDGEDVGNIIFKASINVRAVIATGTMYRISILLTKNT